MGRHPWEGFEQICDGICFKIKRMILDAVLRRYWKEVKAGEQLGGYCNYPVQ